MAFDPSLVLTLVYAVVTLVLVLAIKTLFFPSYPENIPPFPVKPYPILGHLPYLLHGQRQKLLDYRKTTGDVFSLLFGSRLVVVLNGYKVVKEGLVTNADALSDRPPWKHLEGSTNGLIFSNGHLWKEQRTISVSILRSFGMGKGFLATKIHEEVSSYLEALAALQGKPAHTMLLTRTSVSNVICSIIVGKRYEYDDPFFAAFMDSFDRQIQASENTAPVLFWPWLRHIPGNFMGSKTLNKCVHEMLGDFCDKFINFARKDGDDNMPNCFIAEYWKEMQERRNTPKGTYLDETNLKWVLIQLFFAGTDTTSSTIMWFQYYMLNNPEVQEKIYQEIISVVGTGRAPGLQDKSHLNYTVASIMETQRLASIVPTSVPHYCIADIKVGGYNIPPGTTVLPNLDSVMMDSDTWDEPLKFKPERFIDEKGNLIKHEAFMPFSVGRRMCLGEALANMELFLFISSMVQRFQLQPSEPGHPPQVKPVDAIVSAPDTFHARFLERASLPS